MTPQELATAAQNGDRDAFARLWKLYHGEVIRYVYRRTTDHWLAEDITSEAFLRAWRHLGGFTWRSAGFAGWVTAIAGNLVIDHYKSAAHRRSANFPLHDDTEDDLIPPATDRRTDPQQAAEQADLAFRLDQALRQLSDDQREVLRLRFGAGLLPPEAAAVMGRKANVVRSTQWRATKALARNPDLAALAGAA